uniref:Uncharacterized protein n=1 Tax=Magallana gigas TaxID=29159 RepID=K1PYR3_MAGGI
MYKTFVQQEYEDSISTALLEEIGMYEDLDGIDIITDARHGWRKNAKDTSVVAVGEKSHKILNYVHITTANDPEEVTRKVLVKGKEVNIKSVELEDNSGKCRLTLWRNHADSNVAVGSYVRATELVVQTYKEEKSLSTTYKTKLACPEETRESVLIALEKGDVVCSLTFEEGENYPTYTVDLNIVETTALDCGEEAVEEALASMIPIKSNFLYS